MRIVPHCCADALGTVSAERTGTDWDGRQLQCRGTIAMRWIELKPSGVRGMNLATAVNLWPTPMSRDWRSGKASAATYQKNSRPLPEVVTMMDIQKDSGPLNPTWVEWLMGFPLGWTALDASETPSFRKSPK